jgi:hypothetical protein
MEFGLSGVLCDEIRKNVLNIIGHGVCSFRI